MFDMLLWFAVVMVLFAVGDVVAKLTKARISSVFATLMLFLVLFVAGVLPADIIEKRPVSAPLPAGACQCCSSPWGP